MSGLKLRGEGWWPVITFSSTSAVVSPSKSRCRVSISNSTAPRLNRSLRLSARSSTTISGAMYAGLPVRLLSRVPLRVAIPKSMSFTVPSRVIMMLLGLTSRWTIAERSNTYCSARHTRLAMNTDRSTSGMRPDLAVALEVLDQAPAVDVLEDDAHLAVDVLEVEDAADVLVVEDGVPPRLVHEQPHVAGLLGVAELLHDDGALEAGLADEQALVDLAHAARAELLEDLVLLASPAWQSEAVKDRVEQLQAAPRQARRSRHRS